MIEIEVQKAFQGDCIWIRCLSEKNTNIVVDAGPSTFSAGFISLIEKIKNNKEKVNLLIFSHIDDDHTRGSLRYLQTEKEQIIDKVWINGYGTSVYTTMQEHSPNNISDLTSLIEKKEIPIEYPISEGKEFDFSGGKIKVVGPTENEIITVAEMVKEVAEHGSKTYFCDIDEIIDKYRPDPTPTNRASIIFVLEFEEKKLLFPGDSTSENILRAINTYYPGDKFDLVKLPHHGSPRNISREMIRQIKSENYIISTNKKVDKATFKRFIEEQEHTKLMTNYDWWTQGYFTNDDILKYIDTNKIIMQYIGDKKIIL